MGDALLPAIALAERDGAARRDDALAVAIGVHLGELGSEEDDLGGVIHPQQDHHQRAGGAKLLGGAAIAQVQADGILAQAEQQGGDQRAQPDIPPADAGVGDILEDQRKQDRDDGEGNDEIERRRQGFAAGEQAGGPFAQGGQQGGDEQRNQEQEADA